MEERLERLRAIAATREWRNDASVRLSDLAAILEAHDALVAALEAVRPHVSAGSVGGVITDQIDAALALARGEK